MNLKICKFCGCLGTRELFDFENKFNRAHARMIQCCYRYYQWCGMKMGREIGIQSDDGYEQFHPLPADCPYIVEHTVDEGDKKDELEILQTL